MYRTVLCPAHKARRLYVPLFVGVLFFHFFQGIRIIKLFAWERNFRTKIDKARRSEMRSLRSYMVRACDGLGGSV